MFVSGILSSYLILCRSVYRKLGKKDHKREVEIYTSLCHEKVNVIGVRERVIVSITLFLPDSSSSSFKNCQGRWH